MTEPLAGEEFYRVLFEQAREGVFLVDAETFTIVDINDAGARRLGYAREELIGKPIREIHPAHDVPRAEKAREEALASGGKLITGLWHRRKDGTEFPVEISTNVVTVRGRRCFLSVVLDVSQRRESERQLQEAAGLARRQATQLAEAKGLLEAIQECASDAIYLLDAKGIILAANSQALKMMGRSREQVIGQYFNVFSPPEFRAEREAIFARVMRGEEVRYRSTMHRPDRRLVEFDVSSNRVEWNGQHFCFSIVRDTTEEVKREQKLTLYRQIIESTSEGVALIDPQGAYLEQNAAHARILGYSDEELVGQTQALHLVEPTFGVVAAELARTGRFHGEVLSRTKSGALKDIELSAFVVRDEKGEPVCFVGIKRDITERKRAEERLRKLSQAVEQSPSIVMITDPACIIEYVNPKFTEVTGFAAEEIRGTSAFDLGDQPPQERERMMQILNTRREWRGEFHNRKKNGEYYWERATLSAVRDEHGAVVHWLKMAEDITDLKRKEEDLRRAMQGTRRAYARLKRTQAQLVRSERLASAGMLLSGVAHEINNPIHVIAGNLKLLRERCGKLHRLLKAGAKARDVAEWVKPVPAMLDDALRAAEDARRVIVEFREFARDPRAAEDADLNRCVDGALKALKPQLEGVWVVRRLGKLPPVRCVPGQIQQALCNLMKNAVEAMGGKGTLQVSTACRNRHIECVVSDTGRGIPREHLSKVFEPFFTTKGEGRLGLGLPITATIAQNHGGKLRITSRSRRGTTATLVLPAPPVAPHRKARPR